MSLKLKGTLLGILASLGVVVVWILVYVYLDFIVGWIGAFMGLSFLLIYQKINPEDNTKYKHIVAIALMLLEVLVAELLSVAFIAISYEVPVGVALKNADIQRGMFIDILVGYAFSFAVYFGYLSSMKRRKALQNQVENNQNCEPQPTAESNENNEMSDSQTKTQESPESKENDGKLF